MDNDNSHMDDKVYTCFYCHSALTYEACLSGSHFCLQGTNALEFWGNVVKKTTEKNLEEDQEGENDEDEGDTREEGNEEEVNEEDPVEEVSLSVKGIKKIRTSEVNEDMDPLGCSDSKDGGSKSGEDKDIDECDAETNVEVTRQLLELIGQRPPLYDSRLPKNERNAETRVKLWQEVYDALMGTIPLVDLPKRFKSLKERYFKEKKKPYGSEWPFLKTMSYLNATSSSRTKEDKKKSTDSTLPSGIELRMTSPLRNGFSMDDSYYNQSFDDDIMPQIKHRSKRKFEEVSDHEEAMPSKKSEFHENWDEDDFFGAYLVRLLKKIPVENKLSLHMDIMKMVHSSVAKAKSKDTTH